ncbi:hypothetical protein RclHR1_07890012 [Rhizophagus clarus]|uniref:Uncharacterized protein n=1 Tax=Rhizophagus clarus TaxID=94130 RepID=A0A2Z6SA63_9GLOM|nr:hypothetical protein RclHR1_07890012 [Rhizophagus clarus]GES97239.1 hypothetical protein GLOIN_2v1678821 [Rhizophagus clarus]
MNNNNNVDANLSETTASEAVSYLQQYIENEKKKKDAYSELNEKHNSLLTDYQKLKERCVELERINSNLQSALGNVTNFRLNDNDKNNSVQFTEDILRLQDALEIYVTNLRPKIEVNSKNVNNLLSKYKSKTRLSSKSPDIPLTKAVLQRHVLETIFSYISLYADNTNFGEPNSLEAMIANKSEELIQLTQKFGKTREGNDSITPAVPIKIRQQIYSALGNRGFSNIITNEQETCEHFFINNFKIKLNEEMEQYRKILDPTKKKEIEEKAVNIILDVVRIFFFRIQTQEPIGQIRWFRNKDKIDTSLMIGMWNDDDEIDDFEVDICKFPLVGIELDDKRKCKIYTQAIIHPQEVQDSKHKVDKHLDSESNFNVDSRCRSEQSQPDAKILSRSEEFKPESDKQTKLEHKPGVNINLRLSETLPQPQSTLQTLQSQHSSSQPPSQPPQTPQSQHSNSQPPSQPPQTPQSQHSNSQSSSQTPQSQHSNSQTPQTPQSQHSNSQPPQTPQSQHSNSQSSSQPPQSQHSNSQTPQTPQTQHSNSQTPQTPQTQHSNSQPPQTPQSQHSNSQSSQTPQSQHSNSQTPQTPQTQHFNSQPPQTPQSQHSNSQSSQTPQSQHFNSQPPQTPQSQHPNSQTPQIPQTQSLSQSSPSQSQSSSEVDLQANQESEGKKKHKKFGIF